MLKFDIIYKQNFQNHIYGKKKIYLFGVLYHLRFCHIKMTIETI